MRGILCFNFSVDEGIAYEFITFNMFTKELMKMFTQNIQYFFLFLSFNSLVALLFVLFIIF